MNGGRRLSEAFYSHPAFVPHLLLKRVGIRRFWLCNATLTLFSAAALFLCSRADGSLVLGDRGFGFLEHPAIFGWFLIQLCMPPAILRALGRAVRANRCYRKLATAGTITGFREQLYEPLLLFVGLRTARSRLLFSILFTIGFGGFAWNTYQNLFPARFVSDNFWDSVSFSWGYFGTRIYKFYMDALLLPSIIHIFAGIVSTNIVYLRRITERKMIRVLPFSSDRAGGMMFLADLILSPVVTALLVSGLSFAGAVYVHKSLNITVGFGVLVEVSILFAFYVVPTATITKIIGKLKFAELSEIYQRQQSYYDKLLKDDLHGRALKEAYEYSQYCREVVKQINHVPKWPHLAKVFGAFGLSISPALALSAMGLASEWARFFLSPS